MTSLGRTLVVLLALPRLLQNANRKDDGVVCMEQKKRKKPYFGIFTNTSGSNNERIT